MSKQQSSSLPVLHATTKSSRSSSSTSTISCFHLKGHLDSVLCLDYDHDTNHLLSGSEDKTARLWDLRSCTTSSSKPLRASLCIQCPGEVNSVVFGPLRDRESAAAASSSSLFGRDCCVSLAVENSVYGYDLRNATSPVIQWNDNSKSALSSTRRVMPISSTDEINQIVFSQQKRKQSIQHQQQPPLFLAAADDAGEIRVTNQYWMNQEQHQTGGTATPQLQHSAPGAMITACAFRPNQPCHHQNHNSKRNKKHKQKKHQHQHRKEGQDERLSQQQSQQSPVCTTELLATGGTDCTVQLWGVSSSPHQQHQQDGKELNNDPQQSQEKQQQQQPPPPPIICRPLEQHTMQTLQSGASQVCNPPMVHSLDWSPSGRILAAGLGDGSISLFTVHPNHKKPLVQVARLEDAHGGAVASVHFPCTNNNNNAPLLGAAATAPSPDRLLLTAGNDGVVVAWDLGAPLCEPLQQQDRNNHHHHNKDSHLYGDKHDKTNDNIDDDALSHWMRLLQLGECESEKSSKKDDDDNKDKGKGDDDDDYDFDDCKQPKTLFGIQHGIKPNWMVTNYNSTPCTIFVADTSNDITCYYVHSL